MDYFGMERLNITELKNAYKTDDKLADIEF